MPDPSGLYDVGGILLPRPFKIRRFGHFGYNTDRLDESLRFFTDVLGFRVTDEADLFESVPPGARAKAEAVVTDPRMYFTTHGSDHHALLLAHRTFGTFNRNDRYAPDNTLSQITWQVGGLREVAEAVGYLRERGVRIGRVGRDMPGSNWHVYFLDPDGNTLELYYGMEQIGWGRNSKPRAMHDRAFDRAPELPQMSEAAEVREARERGVDVDSGWRPDEAHLDERYDVEGVLLPRPFKVTKLGPVSMFTSDLDGMLAFYTGVMGFAVTETAAVDGRRVAFLRHGAEHHSLVLADKALRERLRLSPHTSNLAMGMEVGTYRQLRDAVAFLTERGFERRDDLPADLHRGIDLAAYFTAPDGHLVQLYYYMETVGWDGRPRPRDQRRDVCGPWPETLEPLSDTYADQTFMGPLG
ncbi:VOC family protein [Actinomadura chibensis]|uniref:Extradiol dioxygenase n=1 Tax=Actinomadura chibensis TaxID=392828 RepID=A0A5D0NDK8_9ACTN|nr:VOC family protein [Actinomadura chibensis]TYB42486.1 extradiol dioxygenase [Actinomadura chibensis]